MGHAEKKNSQKTFLEYGFLKILAVTVKPLSLTKHAHVDCWKKKKKSLLTAIKDSRNPETTLLLSLPLPIKCSCLTLSLHVN